MKKTFTESWFVYCQPGSKLMHDLVRSNCHWKECDGKDEYDTRYGEQVFVIQSETLPDNYVLFEVIRASDYIKYNSGLKDIKEANEKVTTLTNDIIHRDKEIASLKERNKDLHQRIENKNDIINNLEDTIEEIQRSLRTVGEIEHFKDEFNQYHYSLRDYEIDDDLYSCLKRAYENSGVPDMIEDYSERCGD